MYSLQTQTASTGPSGAITTKTTELRRITQKATLTTQRFDSPAKLQFSTIERSGILLPEGSSVTLQIDGWKAFKGYVFTSERNENGEVSYTAYDQTRYLKAKTSKTWEAVELGRIIFELAGDFGLACGNLAATGYAFPTLIKENENALDIIFDCLEKTIVETGKIFNFYDDAGLLTLREAREMYLPTLIGDGSMLTGYKYKRDIDKQTYNRVKLVKPNKESGRTDVYEVEDTETQAKWGLLQYYDKVDESMNEAQITERANQLLKYYNRVLQSFSQDALGVPGLRAGMIIPVEVSAVKSLASTRLLICEKVTHTLEGESHTMKVEVRDFSNLGENMLFTTPS